MRRPARFRSAAALAAALVLASSVVRADDASPRQQLNLNPFWTFQLGDFTGAEKTDFDDAAWQRIGVPHSFSIPYFQSPDFYVGHGWYRKHVALPDSIAGRRVSLEFDGSFLETEVFVNGQSVGRHLGGYTGFTFDVTNAVHAGDNLVAVRVNNLWNPRVAPRAGEHVFSGGLYRNVRLVTTDPLHVAWYGTSIATPEVSNDRATVAVKTEVTNDGSAEKRATVKQEVLDPDGKVVATFDRSEAIAAGKTVTLETGGAIASPKFWHPDHPFRYALRTTILDGDRVADVQTTHFGIRTIKWTADEGFFLNGEHLYIRGVNVHQDQAGWGDAVTDADAIRDVQMIKNAGFNFIRGSHYPHSAAFVEACDRLGLMFWSENAFWSTYSGGKTEGYWNGSGYPTLAADQPAFEANVKQQLAEMIRIHRNSPSIVAWSMCNEPFFSANSVMPKVRTFLRDLVDLSHQLDPTRPAALGGVQRPTDANRLDKIGDVAGYNGDGATIAAFQNPGVPNMVSEYSSTAGDRPGEYSANWADLARDDGKPVHPWRAGQALWCGFDHGSLFGAKFGKMGFVDYFRVPKRSWFWYRNEYRHIPPPAWPVEGTPAKLKLESDATTRPIRTDGTDSTQLVVAVLDADGKPISNSPPVELAIVSGPGEFPTGPSIAFDPKSDVSILDGQAAISFRSYYAGRTTIRATSPGLEPAELTLEFVGDAKFEEGKTPPVAPRPYVKFDRKAQPPQEQTFGRNSPTFPTSSAPDHSGALANDGDAATFWQAAADDVSPAWVVDLERFAVISGVRLTGDADAKMTVDVSDDQAKWRPLVEGKTSGRFVRIRFADAASARLAEVEVRGVLKLQ